MGVLTFQDAYICRILIYFRKIEEVCKPSFSRYKNYKNFHHFLNNYSLQPYQHPLRHSCFFAGYESHNQHKKYTQIIHQVLPLPIHHRNSLSFQKKQSKTIFTHYSELYMAGLICLKCRILLQKFQRENTTIIFGLQSTCDGQDFRSLIDENIVFFMGLLKITKIEWFLKQYNTPNNRTKIINQAFLVRSRRTWILRSILGCWPIGLFQNEGVDLRMRKLLNQQQQAMPTQTVGKKEQAGYSTLGNKAIFPYQTAAKLFTYSSVKGVAIFSEFLLALQEGFLEVLAFFLIFLARTFAVDKFIPTILAALLMLLLFSKSSKASFFFYYIIFKNTQSVTRWYDRLRFVQRRLSMEASDDIRYVSIYYYKPDGMIAGQIESIEFEPILPKLPKQTQYPYLNCQGDACPARIVWKGTCFHSFFSKEIIGRRFSFKPNTQLIKLQNKGSFDQWTTLTSHPCCRIVEKSSVCLAPIYIFSLF